MMGNAIISRRGGGFATVEFENYGEGKPTLTIAPSLSSSSRAAAYFEDIALIHTDYLEVYDKNLVYNKLPAPDETIYYPCGGGASIGILAVFAGGYNAETHAGVSSIYTYRENLTFNTSGNLNTARGSMASGRVKSSAADSGWLLFAGGSKTNYSDGERLSTVDAFNRNMAHGTVSPLSAASGRVYSASVGNYVLFALTYVGSSYVTTVDVYNSNLVKGASISLSEARTSMGAATVGDYALFAGGSNSTTKFNKVDAYNSSLTKTTPTGLSMFRTKPSGGSIGDYALFAGGDYAYNTRDGYQRSCSVVDVYDSNLTLRMLANLSVARSSAESAKVGNYALFAGGDVGVGPGYGGSKAVDAFSVTSELNLFRGSKYKFQNMDNEITVTSDMEKLNVPTPMTGYIKFKNVKLI